MRSSISLLFVLSAACAGSTQTPPAEAPAISSASATPEAVGTSHRVADKEKDRQAILKMAGEYEVDFHFEETASLAKGYEVWEPYESGATEFIEVIADDGDYISLQHVLVIGKRVVKHWRQDWRYQAASFYEFRGNRQWSRRDLSESERMGTWVQRVFQVDDSPRYASHGSWDHRAGVSTWESEETWRPLPRRDYSRRSDYQVLVVTNRHTLTPSGWVHEQDNSKLVLNDDGSEGHYLAREIGTNTYTRTTTVDFTLGRTYWEKTASYWKEVRDEWERRYETGKPVALKDKVDDKRMWEHMFAMAQEVQDKPASPEDMKAQVVKTLDAFWISAP